jgi:tetratricopeptide (TPR) repeat protein
LTCGFQILRKQIFYSLEKYLPLQSLQSIGDHPDTGEPVTLRKRFPKPYVQGLASSSILPAIIFGLCIPELPPASGRDIPVVELKCKILPAPSDRTYKIWKVEIRKNTGEPLRQAFGAGGDTVRFKGLKAGIYILCLFGDKGRSGCQSVDLIPPANQAPQVFVKEIQAPPMPVHQKDSHQVSKTRLAIPDKARKELIKSEEAQLRGETKQALRHLERALELYPEYVDALNNLGTYHHRSANYDRSIKYFARATELAPEFFAGWVNLGGSLLAVGRLVPALEANKRAIKLRPSDALANSQMGMNYFYMRQFDEAKQYFLKVLTVDPSSANQPHLFLAHIAHLEGRPEEARTYIGGYLELHPNSPQAPHLRRTLQHLSTTGVSQSRDTIQREK